MAEDDTVYLSLFQLCFSDYTGVVYMPEGAAVHAGTGLLLSPRGGPFLEALPAGCFPALLVSGVTMATVARGDGVGSGRGPQDSYHDTDCL